MIDGKCDARISWDRVSEMKIQISGYSVPLEKVLHTTKPKLLYTPELEFMGCVWLENGKKKD